MEMEIKVKGDIYESGDDLQVFANAHRMICFIGEAREKIFSRLKHQITSEEEEIFLRELLEILYVEGISL